MSGARPGSRPFALLHMKPGKTLLFEAEAGKGGLLMQQINTDIYRTGLQGKITQELVIGVVVASRLCIDIVRLTRLED